MSETYVLLMYVFYFAKFRHAGFGPLSVIIKDEKTRTLERNVLSSNHGGFFKFVRQL